MKRTVLSLLLAAGVSSALSGCFALAAGGVAGGALVATDRRSSGAYVDDQSIEAKVSHQIGEKLPSAHVNTTSYNRAVLLTGEVPSAEAGQQAELIARAMPNVRRVYNYTSVGPASGLSQRSNDTWITSKVKSSLIANKNVSGVDIKVETNKGVVSLSGNVKSDAERDLAIETAKGIKGVKAVSADGLKSVE